MSALPSHVAPAYASTVSADIERACARIAPSWPLDRFIAVNPLWGYTERPLQEVAARLSALSGTRLTMPLSYYAEEYRAGRLCAEDLRAAIDRHDSERTVAELVELLEQERPSDERALPRRATVVDAADGLRDLVHEVAWKDFVVHNLSQLCAAYFDDAQAQLGPDRSGGLYACWRRQAARDQSAELLMKLRGCRDLVRELPEDATALIEQALEELGIAPGQREAYLTSLLLSINGWAAYCAYRRWVARLEQRTDDAIVELLAMRLGWELVLARSGERALRARFMLAVASWPSVDRTCEEAQRVDWLLQAALENAYQRSVLRALARSPARVILPAPSVQAVFCIDVRSEVFRRALEAQDARIQTLGFAGFFGLPADYVSLGASEPRPQLPGLLAPRVRVADVCDGADRDGGALAAVRTKRLSLARAFKKLKTSAVSGFSFVEAFGPLYAAKLAADSVGMTRTVAHPERAGLSAAEHARRKPRLAGTTAGQPLDLSAQADLAAGILRAMSLTERFARLILLVGHGSESVNNPHAAGLDCGACCGQTGEANARAVAALLNDASVRMELQKRGIEVPSSTHFLPALHNTTTDDVELFDVEELPSRLDRELAQLKGRLTAAAARARRERAPALGELERDAFTVDAAIRHRARDWSEVRPEWGLAGNAAFVVAPRERTRRIRFGGRAFLHEYRCELDPEGSVLELIMTAPMIVAHWINFQYYASTVDNARYGSGNKVLHNVVGGHIGVFEGNGGDLRIGLPMQSLHDGCSFVHKPLRLNVFIEATCEAMDRVLGKHGHVRQLVEGGWLHLFQLEPGSLTLRAYRDGRWLRHEMPRA